MESAPIVNQIDGIFNIILLTDTQLLSSHILLSVIGILVLLILSALVSSSEVAFFSLRNDQINNLLDQEDKSSRAIVSLRSNPKELLATILISNNFINIGIVLLADFTIKQVYNEDTSKLITESIYNNLGFTFFEVSTLSSIISFSITVVSITFMLVLFGEVMPKVYANINNIQVSRLMARPLFFLRKLFAPLIMVLVRSTRFLERKLSGKTIGSGTSRQDIDEAIELTVLNEKNAKQDIEILKGIVKFGDVTVKQIMRSRLDVIAIEKSATDEEVIKTIKDSGYSRIPVFEEEYDKIIGILFIKDLINQIFASEPLDWLNKVREDVLFVPESKKINDLLNEFKEKRMHMAIVVDEYGGTLGLITLEDILEEVIGEIRDEFDDAPEVEYRQIDKWNFIFEGKTMLNDICRILDISTDTFDSIKGESDSIAGLVLEHIGAIPIKGTEVSFQGIKINVVSVNKRRIENIKITLPK